MADKTIKEIPLVSEVNDDIKVPASTGGIKAAAVSVGQIKKHVKADILSQTVTTDASKAPSSLAVHGKFEKQQRDINAVGARVDELEKGGGSANITVDATVIPGSENPVSGGAVAVELGKKVTSSNMATINGRRLDEKQDIIINGGNNGSVNDEKNVLTQNAIITKHTMGKVFFDKEISSTGTMVTKSKVNATDYIELKTGHRIVLSSGAGTVKGAFYNENKGFMQTLSKAGTVVDMNVDIPEGAKFLRANLNRAYYMIGIDKVVDLDDNNVEGVLPSVKNFAKLTPVRKEKGYIMEDGTVQQYKNVEAIAVYDVTNITEVFVNGTDIKINNGCSWFWMRDSQGRIIESIARVAASETFNNTRIVMPTGTTELWAFVSLQLSVTNEQNEINSNLFERIENTEQVADELQNNMTKMGQRITVLENASPANPNPETPANPLNHWKGKKIVWFGASAPKGQTDEQNSDLVANGFVKKPYPVLVGEMLGAKVINTSIAGIHAEAQWNGQKWIGKSGGSISLTLAEYGGSLGGFYSWEGCLQGNEDADLYVFDIEVNNSELQDITSQFDFLNWKWKTRSDWDSAKGPITDFESHRDTYQGAMLYLIEKIRQKNEKARFAFVSEITYLTQKWNEEQPCTTSSKQLSSICNIPHIDLHRRMQVMGWNKWNYYEAHGHPRSSMHLIIARIIAGELLQIA